MTECVPSPLLTVLIPIYNEIGTIDELLRQVAASPLSGEQQIVAVDGGSTDGTVVVLERWRDEGRIELLRPSGIKGKGGALKAGLAAARGRFTIIQDADLEYDPQDYARLLEPLVRGEADVVYGSRYLEEKSRETRLEGREPEKSRRPGDYLKATKGTAIRRERWVLDFGVRMLNLAVRMLYGGRITDEATCYKLFPTDALRAMQLDCEKFEFCPEVTAKAYRMGLRLVELPIHYAPRSAAEGKKLKWTDGIQAFTTLWHYRRWRAPTPLQ
jgi:glycosyltransferase involved in cell wall biosynthesis